MEKNYKTEQNKESKFENINLNSFSFFKIGLRTLKNDNHWTENFELNPRVKTLLCLGGDATNDKMSAKGNINLVINALGFTELQKSSMQLCAHYNSRNLYMHNIFKKKGILDKKNTEDRKIETLHMFLPFMAQKSGDKYIKYSGTELAKNFRNIIIVSHCYGINELNKIFKYLNEELSKLGYNQKEKSFALRQILSITNNSQNEINEKLGFSTINRYSVTDGLYAVKYDKNCSCAYPIFVSDCEYFNDKSGNKSCFITLRKNEVLMLFDKVFNDDSKYSRENEHNVGFFDTETSDLTEIGQKQAVLIRQIVKLWYDGNDFIPDIKDFIKLAVQGTDSDKFVTKSFIEGNKLKTTYQNLLTNHHILSASWNKFNSREEPEHIGIWNILLKSTQNSK